MKLTDRELLFLSALCSYKHGHVGQDTLRSKLEGLGVTPDEFKQLKKTLLYSGAIGVVYGNVTLEDESLRGLVEGTEPEQT